MRTKILTAALMIVSSSVFIFSCQKQIDQSPNLSKAHPESGDQDKDDDDQGKIQDPYNLNVALYGTGEADGYIRFRQDPDPPQIVTLDTKIHHLLPNHEYLLQRAVDTQIDGNCTGAAWLTLGLGLTPRSILTNGGGNGHEVLWRDLSAIPAGSMFDIHFRIVDAVSKEVVLTSGCYTYTVR